MNWRFFGSSGRTKKTNEPNTIRFTMCEKNGNIHIKTLFKKDNFISWGTCHDVMFSSGYTKSTNNTIINGPFNHDIDFNVIQLNHYKCKTLPEFKDIRRRGRADLKEKINENIEEVFKCYDINEIEDLNAYNFYKTIDINYKYNNNNNNSNSKINVIYNNKMNKSLLFMFVCLPARFLLAFLAYKINLYYLPFLSIISFFIGVQFIRHYIKNEPKIGFFGSTVWWENYRLIHGIDYLLFSLAAFFKNKNAWFFLLLDAIFALIFFMYEKYLVNKDIDNTNSFNHLDY